MFFITLIRNSWTIPFLGGESYSIHESSRTTPVLSQLSYFLRTSLPFLFISRDCSSQDPVQISLLIYEGLRCVRRSWCIRPLPRPGLPVSFSLFFFFLFLKIPYLSPFSSCRVFFVRSIHRGVDIPCRAGDFNCPIVPGIYPILSYYYKEILSVSSKLFRMSAEEMFRDENAKSW